MAEYHCHVADSPKLRTLFLALPRQLYGKDCPQDRKTEKQLLMGTHPLSSGFQVIPIVTTDRNGKAICRCMLTYYPREDTGYLGFFEARDDLPAVKTMLQYAEEQARKDGKKRLLGPVDASIYIGYRFKLDRFDKTYTGEPYNKPYYAALWEACGFTLTGRYVSNQLRQVAQEDIDPRLCGLRDRFLARGYRFVTLNPRDFEQALADIWASMMHLYSGFAGFQPISREQFVTMFSHLRSVLNFSMVKLVYKENALKAFAICLPNYGTLTRGRLTPLKFLRILRLRRKPKEYIVLYVGAESSASGLGGALVHEIRNALHQNGCTSIGALIKEGNITGKLYGTLYTHQFHYGLFQKEL